jgi:hypothetical protein
VGRGRRRLPFHLGFPGVSGVASDSSTSSPSSPKILDTVYTIITTLRILLLASTGSERETHRPGQTRFSTRSMADRDGFQQFVAHQPKRKRAAVVCVACHEKKVRTGKRNVLCVMLLMTLQIKCDLQEVTTHGYSTCTNCAATGNECRQVAAD